MDRLKTFAICTTLLMLPIHQALAASNAKGTCGTCHATPNTMIISDGFGRSLDPDKLQRASPEELKNDLLEFAKRRVLIIKFLNKDLICRALARYISAPVPDGAPCPDTLKSKDGDLRASMDSASEQQKEFTATVQGTSTKLIQRDQKVIDSLKLLIVAGFGLDLAPNITVEIYQPTYFQTPNLNGPLVTLA